MEKISNERISVNFARFIEKLNDVGVPTEKLIEIIGHDNLANATYASNIDSGYAFNGSFIEVVMRRLATYCVYMNGHMQQIKADDKSLIKVALLSQIAKATMFEENDNSWEKTNLGRVYKFASLPGALRCGERSFYLCVKAGITFTEEEYEAMRALDKTDDDSFQNAHGSMISVIIKNAAALVATEGREEYKKANK